MVSLVARQNMKIAGKVIKAGETFEISDRYALTLLATRQASKAAVKPAKAVNKDKPDKPKAESAEEKPKYKTRRLKAGDD